MRRKMIACGVLCAGAAFATSVWTGTWKMRSRPDGKVASRTIRIVESGPESYQETFDEVSAQGKKGHSKEVRVCDGREHPGESPGEAHICQVTGPLTRRLTRKQDGKVVMEVTHSLSANGKVLTVTDVQTGAKTIYDKQP